MLIDINSNLKETNNDNITQVNNITNSPEKYNNNKVTREIYYFKNEMLKEFNQIEERINSQISLNSINLAKNHTDSENHYKFILAKTDSILEKMISYDSLIGKVDLLMGYKKQNDEKININKKKIDEINLELKNHFNKYDKALKNQINFDELVGENCQFKTYPQMMKYIMDNILCLNEHKEKSNIEASEYKNKFESLMYTFKSQINSTMKSITELITHSVNDCEVRMKGLIHIYDERLVELRAENSKNLNELNEKYEKLSNEVLDIKKEIYERIDTEVLNLKHIFNNDMSEFKDELNKLGDKYAKLDEEINSIKTDIQNSREKRINNNNNNNKNCIHSKQSVDEDEINIVTPLINEGNSVFFDLKNKKDLKIIRIIILI